MSTHNKKALKLAEFESCLHDEGLCGCCGEELCKCNKVHPATVQRKARRALEWKLRQKRIATINAMKDREAVRAAQAINSFKLVRQNAFIFTDEGTRDPSLFCAEKLSISSDEEEVDLTTSTEEWTPTVFE